VLDPLQYYRRRDVLENATRYLRGRWIAVHCEKQLKDGRPMLIRYLHGVPLSAETPSQLLALLSKLSFCKPRSIYGTAALFKTLQSRRDLAPLNMRAYTPTWDIDSQPEHWRRTLAVARALLDEIARHGVRESVWLKWSGRGMHIHIHESAVSPAIYEKYAPLDVAYSIVEYILRRAEKAILAAAYPAPIKVENLIDPQRVFTAPLSLHRTLDKACVPLKPDDLGDFTPEWTNPLRPRYNPEWDAYTPGEADRLALKALRSIGGYPGPKHIRTAVTAQARRAVPPPPPEHPPQPPSDGELDIRLNPTPPVPLQKPPRAPEDVKEELSAILSRYALAIDPRGKTLALLKALEETARINPRTRHLVEEIVLAERLVEQLEPTQLRALLKPPARRRGDILGYL